MKVRFWYVRHGETLFNVVRRMQGWCDSPLTEEGIRQAENTASVLRNIPFSRCFSSSSERAMDTAEILCRYHGLKPVPMKELKEFDFGELDGEMFDERIGEIQPHRLADDWTDVGGENVELFRERAEQGFAKILAQCSDGEEVLIVSHGSYATHLMKTLLEYDQKEYIERMKRQNRPFMPNCGIYTFLYEDGKWMLEKEPMFAEEYRASISKTVQFLFIRHGETEFNIEKRMQGWSDSGLTEKGIEQAKKAAERLADTHIDRAYCSSSERTRDTAEILLAPHSVTAVPDKRLREVFYGNLEGAPYLPIYEEIVERHVSVHYSDVNGEDREDVNRRIDSFLTEAADASQDGDTVLLISHMDLYFCIMEHLFDTPREILYNEAEAAGTNPAPNCGVMRFEYRDGSFRLIHKMI